MKCMTKGYKNNKLLNTEMAKVWAKRRDTDLEKFLLNSTTCLTNDLQKSISLVGFNRPKSAQGFAIKLEQSKLYARPKSGFNSAKYNATDDQESRNDYSKTLIYNNKNKTKNNQMKKIK